jgi:hypothetical protein
MVGDRGRRRILLAGNAYKEKFGVIASIASFGMAEETLHMLQCIKRKDLFLKKERLVLCPALPQKAANRRNILTKITQQARVQEFG